jgi:hypothetical protein
VTFAINDLVYLRPSIKLDFIVPEELEHRVLRVDDGKLLVTGLPVCFCPQGEVAPLLINMEDAIPAAVYHKLPHYVEKKKAELARKQRKDAESSELAVEERRFRERRDYMLRNGEPMPHCGMQYSFFSIPAVNIRQSHEATVTVDGVTIGRLTSWTPQQRHDRAPAHELRPHTAERVLFGQPVDLVFALLESEPADS